jgi:hypothetical protein
VGAGERLAKGVQRARTDVAIDDAQRRHGECPEIAAVGLLLDARFPRGGHGES